MDIARKNRMINLDLLRIIAMIMIVSLHFLSYCGILDETIDIKNFNIVFSWTLECLCMVAVNIYVLISGYFLIDSTFKWKKFFLLWGEVFFYTFLLFFVNKNVKFNNNIKLEDYIKTFFPICTKHYWFMTIYILLYILSPYLNILIRAMRKESYRNLIVVMFFSFSILSTFLPNDMLIDKTHGYGIIWFVFLYLVAAYIKIYIKDNYNKNFILILYICTTAITVVLKLLSNTFFNKYTINLLYYNSTNVFITSVCLFMYFKKIKIKNNIICIVIEFISKYTLGVYLIHCNIFLKVYLWKDFLKTCEYINSKYFILIYFGIVLSVFFACIIIDFIRKQMWLLTKKIYTLVTIKY